MKNSFIIVFLIFSFQAFSQNLCQKLLYCSHSNSNIEEAQFVEIIHTSLNAESVLTNSRKAQQIVNKILCIANASKLDIDVRPSSCPNAAAVLCSEKRFILFNTAYLEEVMQTGDTNVIYGIFAHEVGHLVRGDAWLSDNNKHQAELNADEFAGRIMGFMGLSDTTALLTLSLVNINETITHPPKSLREAIIKKSWKEGLKVRNELEKIESKRLNYIENCKSDNDSPFNVQYNSHRISTKSLNDVRVICRIVGRNKDLKSIKSVKYYLHPNTFQHNVVEFVGNHDLDLNIYGSFELRTSILCEEEDVLNEYLIRTPIEIYDRKTGKRRGKKGSIEIPKLHDITDFNMREENIVSRIN